jgi:hypothetical protein
MSPVNLINVAVSTRTWKSDRTSQPKAGREGCGDRFIRPNFFSFEDFNRFFVCSQRKIVQSEQESRNLQGAAKALPAAVSGQGSTFVDWLLLVKVK